MARSRTPTFDDVAAIALALSGVTEEPIGHHRWRGWKVDKRFFAWERPMLAADVKKLGSFAPTGDILAVRTNDPGEKAALLASDPAIFFDIAHFQSSDTVLVRLDRVTLTDLRHILKDAWYARAPKKRRGTA